MAKVDGRLPDNVAGLLHRYNGRLAGILTQTQPSGRRQLEHVVGVENLGLRYGRPVRRDIVGCEELCADQEKGEAAENQAAQARTAFHGRPNDRT